jgi:DtxR family Mn-dependent transcriptional regulator
MEKNLSSSSQDYLEAILELSTENQGVRVTDIANILNIKKASVTQAINILSQEGLVIRERYGPVFLTEKGFEEAERVKIKHSLLKYFFEKVLGVKKEIAENDACLIEHSLSEETFLFFAEFLNKEGHLDEFPKKSKLKEIICEDYRERYDGLSLCKK